MSFSIMHDPAPSPTRLLYLGMDHIQQSWDFLYCLVLMKLESGRLQDLADISRMLGCADESQVDEVRKIIISYRPQDMDDLESMLALGRLEHE